MKLTRLLGFGTICVSTGIGVWACQDDGPTGAATNDDGGVRPTLDSSVLADGGLPFDAGDAAPWCGAVDGGAQSRCAKYQWDDFPGDAATEAGANCKACPGRVLTCADLVRRVGGEGTTLLSPRYDNGSKTLSVDITEHAAEIVGAAVTVTHATCFSNPASDASTFTTQVQVNGNELTAPLANYLDDAGGNDAPCGEVTYQLIDSCCTESVVKFETYFDSESSLYKTFCPDGG